MEEEPNSQSLEETIKRVVCIEDAKVEPAGENTIIEDIVKVVDVVKDVVYATSTTVVVDGVDAEASPEKAEDPTAAAAAESDPESEDSEDDLQLIVNDEDIFYPHGHGGEGGEEPEGEEMFVVAGEEHYEEVDWAAEMHYHHSQFFKYVRPGSGPATVSPGIQDPAQQTPGSAGPPGPFTPGYGMGLWNYPFEAAYEFVLPASKTIFDIDVEQFEDKPWVYPGVDVTDYFNFGFTEETWKQYCEDFARARDEASRTRDDESGQGWYDNAGYNESSSHLEPQKGRGRMRNNFSGRAVQLEGGANERRSSGDIRRQRLRGSVVQIPSHEGRSRHESHGEFRRKQRSDELQRRKGFTSAEQATPLGGRLSRAPSGPFSQSPGGMFSSPGGRSGMYTPRSRMSSPGRLQGSLPNGSRRLSSDYSSKSWRGSSRRNDELYDEDEGSYGSSGQSESGESDRYESEDEYYSRNHRLKRFSSQPLESRLGVRAEVPAIETEPPPEKRSVKLSRHAREEEEKEKLSEPASNRRFSQKTERSSASAQVVTLKRSSEVVTERRSSQAVKKLDQAVRETISTRVTEVKTTVERKVTPAVLGKRLQPAVEKPGVKKEPVTEKKLQSISERRAQLVAEKRAEKLLAEKREREAKLDNRERASVKVDQRERQSGAEKKVDQREHRVHAAGRKVDQLERLPAAERKIDQRERLPAVEKKVDQRERLPAERKERLPTERKERLLDSLDHRERLSTSDVMHRSVRGKEQTSLVSSTVPEKRLLKPASGPSQQLTAKTRNNQPKIKEQDNGDLRLKVLERVSARWKFHLRMDDEHAKKKRENLNKPARRKDEGSFDANGDSMAYEVDGDKSPEKVDDSLDERTRREERKGRHRETRRQCDDDKFYEDPVDYDEAVDERWQMDDTDKWGTDRKRKRRERNEYAEEWDEGDDEAVDGIVSNRQYLRDSSSRRRYDDDVAVDDTWEMEEGECEDDLNPTSEDERWNVNEYDEEHDHKRKRRRYNYDVYKDTDNCADAETYDYDGVEETRRDYFYDGSTSSGHGDEIYFKGRGGKSFRRDSDRWTGTLYDSGDEYDE